MATPAAECAVRDPKGLYARAQDGSIDSFTGVDDPYEVPEHPDLAIEPTVTVAGRRPTCAGRARAAPAG